MAPFYRNGILDCLQDGLNASMCSNITLTGNDTSVESTSSAAVLGTSHLSFMAQGTLLVGLPLRKSTKGN